MIKPVVFSYMYQRHENEREREKSIYCRSNIATIKMSTFNGVTAMDLIT